MHNPHTPHLHRAAIAGTAISTLVVLAGFSPASAGSATPDTPAGVCSEALEPGSGEAATIVIGLEADGNGTVEAECFITPAVSSDGPAIEADFEQVDCGAAVEVDEAVSDFNLADETGPVEVLPRGDDDDTTEAAVECFVSPAAVPSYSEDETQFEPVDCLSAVELDGRPITEADLADEIGTVEVLPHGVDDDTDVEAVECFISPVAAAELDVATHVEQVDCDSAVAFDEPTTEFVPAAGSETIEVLPEVDDVIADVEAFEAAEGVDCFISLAVAAEVNAETHFEQVDCETGVSFDGPVSDFEFADEAGTVEILPDGNDDGETVEAVEAADTFEDVECFISPAITAELD